MQTREHSSCSAGYYVPSARHSNRVGTEGADGATTMIPALGVRVTPFLPSLLRMVNNGDMIFDDGKLIFDDTNSFVTTVLSRYFPHTNLASFRRQLKNFGFQKTLDQGNLKPLLFFNPELKGQHPEAMLDLQRRSRAGKFSAKAAREKGQSCKHDYVRFSGSPCSSSAGEQTERANSSALVTQQRFRGAATPTVMMRADAPAAGRSRRYPRQGVVHQNASSTGGGLTRGNPCAAGEDMVWTSSGDVESRSHMARSKPTDVRAGAAMGARCKARSINDERERLGFCGWQSPRSEKGMNNRRRGTADDSIAVAPAIDISNARFHRGGTEITVITPAPSPRCEVDDSCWNGRGEAGPSVLQNLATSTQLDFDDFDGGRNVQNSGTSMSPIPLQPTGQAKEGNADLVYDALGDDGAHSDAAVAATPMLFPDPSGSKNQCGSPCSVDAVGLFRPCPRYEDFDFDFDSKSFGDNILEDRRLAENEEDWGSLQDRAVVAAEFPAGWGKIATTVETDNNSPGDLSTTYYCDMYLDERYFQPSAARDVHGFPSTRV